jgi:hypothetical protein
VTLDGAAVEVEPARGRLEVLMLVEIDKRRVPAQQLAGVERTRPHGLRELGPRIFAPGTRRAAARVIGMPQQHVAQALLELVAGLWLWQPSLSSYCGLSGIDSAPVLAVVSS